VHGTTGYNFAILVNGLFIDARARNSMDRVYRSFIGDDRDWAECAFESKILVMCTSLSAELNILANQLADRAMRPAYPRLHASRAAARSGGGDCLLSCVSDLRDGCGFRGGPTLR
jgi:maltooligosyltrehalose synthase